ncbi:MAG TPA: hypothetical protein VH328_06340 [Burkholderiaceae bacterium]|nr:hypothetical protein [Burkholderiaceae bacterium]
MSANLIFRGMTGWHVEPGRSRRGCFLAFRLPFVLPFVLPVDFSSRHFVFTRAKSLGF